MRTLKNLWLIAAVAFFLTGCSDDRQQAVPLSPQAFHSDDECHVCGMVITRFPGPKGQVLDEQAGNVKKFCSVSEMVSWLVQPENRHALDGAWVHDMAQSPWDKPDDSHLVKATDAFYVPDPALQGAMGMSLASFAKRSAAENFASIQHSQVLDLSGLEQHLANVAAPSHMHH